MSSEEDSRLSQEEKFIGRVLRYQEGVLSAEEVRQLNEDLRANPERLAVFARIYDTSRLVHEVSRTRISLLSQTRTAAAQDATARSARPVWKRAFLPIVACLVGLLGILILKIGLGIRSGSGAATATVNPVELDGLWRLVAGEGAEYSIVTSSLVRLRSGELEFSSAKPAGLVVETPNAVATARGTRFLIGHHSETSHTPIQNQPDKTMKPDEMTRLLVLAGMVTMTTDGGSVQAAENEAAVAGPEGAPVKMAVTANSQFALDLYARLAAENPEKNMFFSPYSTSSALLMAMEGARRETAEEMGDVLGLGKARPAGEPHDLDAEPTRAERAGLRRIARSLDRVHRALPGYRTITCLETTVGSGSNLGYAFHHLAFIRDEVREPERIGFCLDTCHVHAAGYDLGSEAAAQAMLRTFDRVCGLRHLRVLHMNDSVGDRGSRRDRHAHIGQGTIPLAGFRGIVNRRALSRVPKILETPKGEDGAGTPWDIVNVRRLKRLIRGVSRSR